MVPSRRPAAAALIAGVVASVPPAMAADYHLYFLAGQSNMVGYGRVEDLPEDRRAPVDGAVIFAGAVMEDGKPATGAGLWAPVTPGFGVGFTTDGASNTLADRFGPELTFAARLRELRPTERVAIIKYARGGTSLDARADGGAGTWDPDDNGGTKLNQYDHALATIAAATAVRDIDGDGEADRLIPAGIVWMQGESDAATPETAAAYADNLGEIAELFRAALRVDGLPFVVGRISDSGVRNGTAPVWKHGEAVREKQRESVEADRAAALVTTTDTYGYSDPYHYDSAGYIDLGRAFAEAVHGLRSPSVK